VSVFVILAAKFFKKMPRQSPDNTSDEQDENESSSHRFSALLNPIRNIAETFNIDIALELEEYMNDLENLSISFDDGTTGLNFAQGIDFIL
jgi:hypothetical protein